MTTYQRKGKKYSKISFKKRTQLIDLIVYKGNSITQTSKKLHVKLPTAKAILSSFRKKNHVFQRKKESINAVEKDLTQKRQENSDMIQKNHQSKPDQSAFISNQQNQSWISFLDYGYSMPIFVPNMNCWAFYYPSAMPFGL